MLIESRGKCLLFFKKVKKFKSNKNKNKIVIKKDKDGYLLNNNTIFNLKGKKLIFNNKKKKGYQRNLYGTILTPNSNVEGIFFFLFQISFTYVY